MCCFMINTGIRNTYTLYLHNKLRVENCDIQVKHVKVELHYLTEVVQKLNP